MAFVVAAVWKALPGEEEAIATVIETMTPLSRAEPKNLYYQAHLAIDEPGTFFLYEQYTDAGGYEDHRASPHFQEHVVGVALPLLASRAVSTYQTIDG